MTLQEALNIFGEEWIDKARRNLGATRTVVDSKGRRKRRRADASGKLRKSLYFKVRKTKRGYAVQGMSDEEYAAFVEFGVNGTEANHSAPFSFKKGKKSIPTDVVKRWMKVKGLRVREWKDGKLGGFAKSTPSKVNSMAYLIARSIKRNGIPPLRYFTEAYEDAIREYADMIAEAAANDLADSI